MVLQLFIHILLMFSYCLIIANTGAASEALTMAKGNCQPSCGNVSIPFPFGIGKGCFIDEWFEVNCTNNTRPVLKRIGLEVTRIDLGPQPSTLEAKLPITTFRECPDTSRNESVSGKQIGTDLKGSPFAFDNDRNKFTMVGCDSFAWIASDLFGTIVAGCSSVCGKVSKGSEVNDFRGCNGVGCCQTSIPSNLQRVNAQFWVPENKTKPECKYAFLVDDTWFSQSVKNLSILNKMRNVSVVLNWRLYADKMGALGKPSKSFLSNANYSVSNPLIKRRSENCSSIPVQDTSSLVNQSEYVYCACQPGFDGNPYLVDGCKDVDECAAGGPGSKACSGKNCVNIDVYPFYSCEERKKKKFQEMILIGVGCVIGAVFLFPGSWASYKFVKKKRKIQRKKKFFKRNGGLLLQQQLSSGEVNVENAKLFNSKDLEKATDRFNTDRVLGQGGQGTVYKGMLADGKIVAVKKSKIVDEGKVKEFINEVVILSQINHRNVVKLLGCCLETEVPLLVYEYVPNGTLSQYIYEEQEEFPLTWKIRLRIATEIAGALSYLHSSASLPIYHRDIKSTNILLDSKYRAKIADFGTSRSLAIDQTHVSTLVQGTLGYLDPEYFRSSQFTDKSDVYSFGVVLVELLTGQKPISNQRAAEDRSLAAYFMLSIKEKNMFDIVNARVMKEGKTEAITAFAELAKRCLNLNGKKRPTMREVAAVLEDIQALEKASRAAHEEQYFEEDEWVREVPAHHKPWDSFTISKCSTSLGDPIGSSSDEVPLFSSITH